MYTSWILKSNFPTSIVTQNLRERRVYPHFVITRNATYYNLYKPTEPKDFQTDNLKDEYEWSEGFFKTQSISLYTEIYV